MFGSEIEADFLLPFAGVYQNERDAKGYEKSLQLAEPASEIEHSGPRRRVALDEPTHFLHEAFNFQLVHLGQLFCDGDYVARILWSSWHFVGFHWTVGSQVGNAAAGAWIYSNQNSSYVALES